MPLNQSELLTNSALVMDHLLVLGFRAERRAPAQRHERAFGYVLAAPRNLVPGEKAETATRLCRPNVGRRPVPILTSRPSPVLTSLRNHGQSICAFNAPATDDLCTRRGEIQ